MAEGTVVHAYGLVEPTWTAETLTGIGGAPVVRVEVDDLVVLVSRLREETYGPDVWRAHAEDPQWLGAVAAEHHAVLQSVAETADVLPLRLPGIHSDEASLAQTLRGQGEVLETAFARIRGHIELGAKAFVVSDSAAPAADAPPRTGREYLARRSSQAESREATRLRRQAALVEAHEALAAAARDGVLNPPQDAALSGRREPMVLNGAYLVGRDRVEDFIAVAERLADRLRSEGIALEVTGPWPPYNFSSAEPSRESRSAEEVR